MKPRRVSCVRAAWGASTMCMEHSSVSGKQILCVQQWSQVDIGRGSLYSTRMRSEQERAGMKLFLPSSVPHGRERGPPDTHLMSQRGFNRAAQSQFISSTQPNPSILGWAPGPSSACKHTVSAWHEINTVGAHERTLANTHVVGLQHSLFQTIYKLPGMHSGTWCFVHQLPYWGGLENSSSSRIKSTKWHLKITAKECSQCWCLVCLQLQLRAERPYKAAQKGGCSRKLWLSGHFAEFLKTNLDFWFQCKNTCWLYSFLRNCTTVRNTPKLQTAQGENCVSFATCLILKPQRFCMWVCKSTIHFNNSWSTGTQVGVISLISSILEPWEKV